MNANLKMLRATLITAMGLAATTLISHGQILIDDWNFDQTSSPYTNSVAGAPLLLQDPTTTTAGTTTGATGQPGDNAATLQYVNPGPSTSLTAAGALPNTFAFSLFINPSFVGDFNNVIDETSGGSNGTFQLHFLGGTTNSGGVSTGTLEFVVRGTGGSQGFVATTESVSLTQGQFTNISGNYNNTTGEIDLFVNGTESIGAFDVAGLAAGNGTQLAVGTDTSIGAFAYGGAIDDLQIYSGNLSQGEVNYLIANPSDAVPEPSSIALMFAGLGALILYRRFRSSARA